MAVGIDVGVDWGGGDKCDDGRLQRIPICEAYLELVDLSCRCKGATGGIYSVAKGVKVLGCLSMVTMHLLSWLQLRIAVRPPDLMAPASAK